LSSSSGWQNVRCVCQMSPSFNYCEFNIDSGSNIMVGVVDGDCSRSGYAGQYSNGWTYYSQSGVYHAGSASSTGATYTAGDKIGVKVNFDQGTVSFYRNGQLTTSGTGLPKGPSAKIYPVACMSAMNDSVSIVVASKKKITTEDTAVETAAPVAVDDDDMGGLFG